MVNIKLDKLLVEKLKWRSIRRSMLEVDLHLTKFIDAGGLNELTNDELMIYADILELSDSELLLLLQGNAIHQIDDYDEMFKKIKKLTT